MADVDLTPTAEMARNAARGLELRREHGRGGTDVGVARARDISNGKTLSPETVRRMHAFFSRHAKNKAGGEDDAGYIAWMLWGGDEGRDWASRKVDALDRKERNAMSDTRKAIMERLGMAAGGEKAKLAKVDRARVMRELRALRDNARAERNREAERLASMYLAGLNRANTTEDDWEEADMATSKILEVLHGEFSRPGAKAKFAVSITGRRGRQPGIPGGWLTGTWDGGKWAALVFAEGSAEYGLPEFRNISKLWIADKKGKDIVNYDRGWDVKPETPEARQAFMEIGRVASAEASKMPASRPGAKEKFAQPPFSASDLNALKRLVKQYEKLGKESAGELDRAHHHKALAIASTLHEIIDFAASGKTGRAYAQVRISTPEFQKLLPASLVKAAYDVTKSDTYSRPGAKAKMGKWTVVMPSIPDAGTRHFDSWEQAKNYVDTKMGGFTALVSVDGKRYALKHALGQWEKFSRPGAKVRAALADACWEGYEAVGTKPQDGKTVPNCVPKATAAKPAEDDLEREDVKAGLKLMAASDPAVSDKIRKLIKEGKPQDQAVAIALDMKRRGEL